MAFRLQVRNHRGLRAVDWRPEGVCALVGANGSGKSTLLDVPALLGCALERGLTRALEIHGGIADARNLSAPEGEPYFFEVALDEVSWRLAPVTTGLGFRPEEIIEVDHQRVLHRAPGADEALFEGHTIKARDTLAFTAVEEKNPLVSDLGQLLRSYRCYGNYDVVSLRRGGSADSSDSRLDARGINVLAVLRNWRDRREDRRRYKFVIDGLQEMFPDFFDDIDFVKASQLLVADIHLKNGKKHSASLAPDGWYVALLHLAAVASTQPNDVIGIDEPENALHPHALKVLLERLRAWSGRHSVTVLLATHSPVIINQFDEMPEQLFVMDSSRGPVAVTDLKERDWLAHFALGDLYMREELGGPQYDADHRPDHHG